MSGYPDDTIRATRGRLEPTADVVCYGPDTSVFGNTVLI